MFGFPCDKVFICQRKFWRNIYMVKADICTTIMGLLSLLFLAVDVGVAAAAAADDDDDEEEEEEEEGEEKPKEEDDDNDDDAGCYYLYKFLPLQVIFTESKY